MKKGKIVIVSGPSGSGKTTLSNKVLATPLFKGKIVKSISATTRAKRPGERHGRDYLFLTPAAFKQKKRLGRFLESQKVFDNYYGTPKAAAEALLRKGKHVMLCIDVKGAKVVRRQTPQAVTIFIKVPSLAVLKKRLLKRATEANKSLNLRLKIAQEELKEAKFYKYIVINDKLNPAYRRLKEILCKELKINK